MPIGPYADFAACQSAMTGKYGMEGAKKVCGAMEAGMQGKSEQGHEFKELPEVAQSLWMDSFTESMEKNDDVGSAKIAWANVYRHWEKSPSGQWHPFKTLSEIQFKSLIKQDRVIFGAASVAIVDSENELITEGALKTAFNSYITRGHVLFYHKNIPVGEVLPDYKAPDGKTYKSGVSNGKLDIIVRLYKDTQIANDVWDAIEKGELRAFSIGGQVIGDTVKVCQEMDSSGNCTQSYDRIDNMDLHEISIVPNPANDASYFNIIKSKVQPMTVESTGINKSQSDAEKKLAKLAVLIENEKTKAVNCPAFTLAAMKIIKGEDELPTQESKLDALALKVDKLTEITEKLFEMFNIQVVTK